MEEKFIKIMEEKFIKIIDYILKYSSGIGHDYIGKKKLLEMKEDISKLNTEIINPFIQIKIPFEPYKEKLSLKGKNKFPRVISIPSYKDKVILKYLSNLLDVRVGLNLNQREICQVKINKITKLLKENDNYKYCLKIDIKDFYPNINHYILKEILLNKFKLKKEGVDIILKYLENPTLENKNDEKIYNIIGLPQGISISNILSECYLSEFDEKNESKKKGYFRYVDDILIVSNSMDSCKDYLNEMKIKLYKKYHLQINVNKTEIVNLYENPINYLGYQISFSNNNKLKISVKDTNLRNFKLKIDDFFRSYNIEKKKHLNDSRFFKYYVWKLNLLITGFKTKIDDKIRRYGWLNYYSNLNDTYILKKLDNHINNRLKKCNDLIKYKYEIKNFKVAFSKYKKQTNYIPNISDEYDSIDKKRNFLNEICYFLNQEYINRCSDKEIENLFNELHFKLIREMEKDDKLIFDSGDGL
ncbi:MAG: reverse transcriptase domain-containing protein [Fusobacteriaceae bacterium]